MHKTKALNQSTNTLQVTCDLILQMTALQNLLYCFFSFLTCSHACKNIFSPDIEIVVKGDECTGF